MLSFVHFIYRSKMFVSTLSLLVLGSWVAAAHDGDIVGNSYERQEDFDSLMVHDHRQRRAFMSVNVAFRKAWKAILQTTMGSSYGFEEKIFVKVGSMNDAMKDFMFLRPTQIVHADPDGGLRGYVGNQVVELEEDFTGQPVLKIFSGETARGYGVSNSNKIERSIIYFKDATEARGILDAWRLMDK